MERATSYAQRVAVLSFNLLGRQADTGNVDWTWMEQTVRALQTSPLSPEVQIFLARLEQLTGKLSKAAAVTRYRSLAKEIAPTAKFSWTGVKDGARIESQRINPRGSRDSQ